MSPRVSNHFDIKLPLVLNINHLNLLNNLRYTAICFNILKFTEVTVTDSFLIKLPENPFYINVNTWQFTTV